MNTINETLKRSSRMLALTGVASVAFGATVLLWPGISLVSLILLFGAFATISGTFTLGAGLQHLAERRTDWVPFVLSGIGGIAVGGVTFFRPGITGLALLYIIAGFAVVTGAFAIAAAFDLFEETNHKSWTLGMAGLLSVAFGTLIAVYPVSGALAILWLIALYALTVGVTELVYSFRLHQAEGRITEVFRSHSAAS